ncbi:MAG: YdcF family protein [Planctomycetota bacterium]|nr:YdcF family protein [Planctomycetota bacterium]
MVPQLKTLLETLLMPPTSLYLVVLAGLVLARYGGAKRRRMIGVCLAWAGGAAAVALSTPLVAHLLLASLQEADHIAPDAAVIDAEAIVVLSADVDCDPPEYGEDQPGALTVLRCRYGAALARRTGLPILLSGGVLRPDRRPVSHVMRDFVRDELGTPVRWVEEESTTTRGNAEFSARILAREGVQRVALVSHAWHLPRAQAAFEEAGMEILPAPTAPHAPPNGLLESLIPRGKSLRDSTWAVHEWGGRLWYWLGG